MNRVLLGVCLSVSAWAAASSLRGRVVAPSNSLERYTVLVRPTAGVSTGAAPNALTDSSGEFCITGLDKGEYYVSVTNDRGDVLSVQFVTVGEITAPVELRLPEEEKRSRPVSGVISVAALQHKPVRKAERELAAAEKAQKKGSTDSMMLHLRKALAIDPDYTLARNNLAVALLEQKRYGEALRELDTAAESDPMDGRVQYNRAVCLSRMGRLEEAEVSVRRAVKLAPMSAKARYVLGTLMFMQDKYNDETADSLVRGAESFPNARLAAAQMLVRMGRRDAAQGQLRKYLEDGNPDQKGDVQRWLSSFSAPNQTRR